MAVVPYSSQVLFFICKKLVGHQMINSTEILKWLREILICRNKFLLRNKVSHSVVGFVVLIPVGLIQEGTRL